MTADNLPGDFSALLLDCDGVLVDSAAYADEALRLWAVRNSLSPARVLSAVRGKRVPDVMPTLVAPERAEKERHNLRIIELSMVNSTVAFPGAAEMLQTLVEHGAKWAVVTSADEGLARARLRAAGLPMPPVLVAAEHVSAGKPAPDCYQYAASELGAPIEDCLAVDDMAIGATSARAAGASVLRVAAAAAPDGFTHIRSLDAIRVSIKDDRIHVDFR